MKILRRFINTISDKRILSALACRRGFVRVTGGFLMLLIILTSFLTILYLNQNKASDPQLDASAQSPEEEPVELLPEPPPEPTKYELILEHELDWIATLSLSNGAFCLRDHTDGSASISPYFSSITARVLLEAGRGDEDIARAKEYIIWHFEHLNIEEPDYNGLTGTIFDYVARTEEGQVIKETSLEKYDSVDSYAAVFLTLLNTYYEITEDKSFLIAQYDKVRHVAQALEGALKTGLSVTKPDYEVIYLMDNSEVHEGIYALVNLYREVFTQGMPTEEFRKEAEAGLKRWIRISEDMERRFEKSLWNEKEQRYEVSLNIHHKPIGSFGWEKFYPDATSQIFPIIHKVLSPQSERARMLYDTFSSYHRWESMDHVLSSQGHTYWPSLVYAAALMNDIERVDDYLDSYEARVMQDHGAPIYNADAAWVVRACRVMIDAAITED